MVAHLPRCDIGHCRCEARRKWRVIFIGWAVFAVELIGGLLSGSLSLLSDSWHVLIDNLSGFMALWVDWKASNDQAAEDRWRFRGARAQGVLLLVIAGWIALAAWQRRAHQEAIAPTTMIVVAIIGMAANYCQHRILRGGERNLTQRSFDLHVLFDLGQSAAVVIGGILIAFTGVLAIDLVVSWILSVVMGTYGLLLTFLPKFFDHDHHH